MSEWNEREEVLTLMAEFFLGYWKLYLFTIS